MRVGLIADIHGNLFALDAVLAELTRDHVAEIICLGDTFALGPQPAGVIARLRSLGCPTVVGNTDAWLFAPPEGEGTEATRLNAWCAAQLSGGDQAYVRTFLPTVGWSFGGTTLLGFHGSPSSFDDVIVAETPDAALDGLFAGCTADLFIGGHTHIPMVRRYREARIVNVGSVGLPGVGAIPPPNRDVHWAEYAILESGAGGVSITLRRTPLDMPAMMRVLDSIKMPERARWVSKWRQASSVSVGG